MMSSSVVGWRNLAHALSRQGRHEEALLAARRAMRIEPYTWQTREVFGYIVTEAAYQRHANGEMVHAIELYREGLVVDAENAIRWFNLGLAYLNLDQKKEARTAFEKAAALEPVNEYYRNALEYFDE
jgi:tetratricopeptide (TPR) repeat protein